MQYTDMIKASSINYIGYNKVGILDPDGNKKEYSFKELGYPYFYSSLNIISDSVVNYEKVDINVLFPEGIINKPMYKTYTKSPFDIYNLTKDAPSSIFNIDKMSQNSVLMVEDDVGVAYLDRRLGADGVIEWVKPNRYAYIDIETKNGKPFLIGHLPYINGERQDYIPYTTSEDFIDELQYDRIAAVI